MTILFLLVHMTILLPNNKKRNSRKLKRTLKSVIIKPPVAKTGDLKSALESINIRDP